MRIAIEMTKIVTLVASILFGFSDLSHASYTWPSSDWTPHFKSMKCTDLQIPRDQIPSIQDTDDLVHLYLTSSDESCAMTYALEIKKRIFIKPGDQNYFFELNNLKKFFTTGVKNQKEKITDLVYFLQDFYFARNMSYFGDNYSTWNNNKVRLRAATLIIVYAVIIANRKKLPTFLQNNVFDAKKLVTDYLLRVSATHSGIKRQGKPDESSEMDTVISDGASFYASPMEILKNELGWSQYFYRDPLTYTDHQYEVNFASALTTIFGSIVVEESVAFGTGLLMSALGFAETGAAISGTVGTVAAFAAAYVISYYARPFYDQARFNSYYKEIEKLKKKITSADSPYEAHYYALLAMKQMGELYGIIYARLWSDYSAEIENYTRVRTSCIAMTIPSVYVRPYPIEDKKCVHTPYDPQLHGASEYEVCKIHSLLMKNEPARLQQEKIDFADNIRHYEKENEKFIGPFLKLINEMNSLSKTKISPELLGTVFSDLKLYKQTIDESRQTDLLIKEVILQAQPVYETVFQVKRNKDYESYKKLSEKLNCTSPYEDREF